MPHENILLLTDSYKVSHHLQYPENTQYVYSYFESRGGKYPKTLFYGLQYIIKKYLLGSVITLEKIEQAAKIYRDHFGKDLINREGWKYIVDKHGGHLPIVIKAVAEGSLVPVKNVLFTVENTDPKCYWLTNYLETLLVQVWYPMTVATNSYYQKQIIASYLRNTADDMSSLPYKLHDFGFRGVSSVETAGIGGSAHLINFEGTDTIQGIVTARRYYGCYMAGHSIPAAEHSTITTWGQDGELAAFRNMLHRFSDGVVAVVSDSYDLWRACEKYWGEALRSEVLERGRNGGTVVVRPDSGDPETIVVKCLDTLEKAFGSSLNSKGFKMLPPCIRVIQGDGISYDTLTGILQSLKENKWSSENVTFGSGGALLQRLDRDTQKCAYKCSQVTINGEQKEVFKDPITDPGKKSKKGRLTLERNEGEWRTVEHGEGDVEKDWLVTVYKDGLLLVDHKFDEIRERAKMELEDISG